MNSLNAHCALPCVMLEAGTPMTYEGAGERNDITEMHLCWLRFKKAGGRVKEQKPEKTELNRSA